MASESSDTITKSTFISRLDDDLPEFYKSDPKQESYPPAPPHEEGKEAIGIVNNNEVIILQRGRSEDRNMLGAPKILGMLRRNFYTVLIVTLLLIFGAVLAGVLGSRVASKSGSGITSGSPFTDPDTPPSSTETVFVEKASYKYPSLAIAGGSSTKYSKLFTLHSFNNSITFHMRGPNGWKTMGDIPISFVPVEASSLAALSWADENDQFRLYYIDENSQIIQLSGRCEKKTTNCEWVDQKIILKSGVAPTSGLGVAHWGNGSSSNPSEIRLYYADEKSYMYELRSTDDNWGDSGKNTGFSISPGSGIASQASEEDDEVALRVFYHDLNGDVKGLRGSPGRSPFSLTSVVISTTSHLPPTANIATCLYPSKDLSTTYLTVKQIASDGSIIEARKVPSSGDWATNINSGDWDRATDIGGAITCDGWVDENNRSNQVLLYNVNGSIAEYWLHNGAWTRSVIFND